MQDTLGILLWLLEKALANLVAGLAMTDAAITMVVGNGDCTSCGASLSSVLDTTGRDYHF